MEKFKVGVWSVGAAVASVFVQDAGVVSQLKALVLLCAGGNLVALVCAAAIKVEEERQADERAKIKKIDDWYKKLGACRQERQAKADAEWLANLEQRK